MTADRRLILAAAVALIGALAVAALVRFTSPANGAEDAWTFAAESLLERAENGSAQVGDGVFVVGGVSAPNGRASRKVLRYDIGDDAWDEVAPIPRRLDHPGVTAAGGNVYVYGGGRKPANSDSANVVGCSRREGAGVRDSFFRYDPAADNWNRLKDGPMARCAFVFESFQGRLYAAGGRSKTSERVRKLHVYDISERRWVRKPSMEIGRNHIAGGFVDGRLVVTGGRPGPARGNRRTVESFDPAANAWQTEPSMAFARSGHEAVETGDGRLVVFGGEERDSQGDVIPEVEIFDGTSWDSASLPDMATPRHGLAGAAEGNRIYALEGGPQRGLSWSNLVEYLDVPPAP